MQLCNFHGCAVMATVDATGRIYGRIYGRVTVTDGTRVQPKRLRGRRYPMHRLPNYPLKSIKQVVKVVKNAHEYTTKQLKDIRKRSISELGIDVDQYIAVTSTVPTIVASTSTMPTIVSSTSGRMRTPIVARPKKYCKVSNSKYIAMLTCIDTTLGVLYHQPLEDTTVIDYIHEVRDALLNTIRVDSHYLITNDVYNTMVTRMNFAINELYRYDPNESFIMDGINSIINLCKDIYTSVCK
jgi:hypothetical protein